MTERRTVARQRTFLRGVLSFNNGTSSEDALVRNLSGAGARLELPHPHAPESFDLLIPVRNLRLRARKVWSAGAQIGVAFEAAAEARPARAPTARDDLRY